MKTIIYYRKSTDTDDKQQNSLEHQLNNCRRTAELNNLEIFKEIGESKSAKTEFTRDGFNEMIKLCKLKKVDYIICDEPKRLSRNNLDSSRLIDLMDKKQIKGILCTSREYHTENSRDKFLLQLDLSLSKMDNDDRSKDVKDKMMTAFKKGQWVSKAPIGYKNITIKKGQKEVVIDEIYGPFIKKAFEMRANGYSYTKIRDYLFENDVYQTKGKKIGVEQIKRILNNEFFTGIMKWDGVIQKGNYKPLISKELFLKANGIGYKVVHTYKNRVYRLAGLLKDIDKVSFRGYTKKDHIYYINGVKSNYKINISEKLVFEKFGEIIKQFQFPKELKEISEDMLKEIYYKSIESKNIDLDNIKKEITKLNTRKSNLVDSFLDGDIEKDIYKIKLKELEEKILIEGNKLKPISKIYNEKLKKIKKGAELYVSLYTSYSKILIEEKLNILKSLGAELFVNTKKELYIAENRLSELLKKLNFHIWYSKQRQMQTISALYDYTAKNIESTNKIINDLKDIILV